MYGKAASTVYITLTLFPCDTSGTKHDLRSERLCCCFPFVLFSVMTKRKVYIQVFGQRGGMAVGDLYSVWT